MDLGLASIEGLLPTRAELMSAEEFAMTEEMIEDFEQDLDRRLNLVEAVVIIETHGITPAVQDIFDEGGQLTSYLGMEFKEENKQDIITALETKIAEVEEESSTEDLRTAAKRWLTGLVFMVMGVVASLTTVALAITVPFLAPIASFIGIAFAITAAIYYIGGLLETVLTVKRVGVDQAIDDLFDGKSGGGDNTGDEDDETGDTESLKSKGSFVKSDVLSKRLTQCQNGLKLVKTTIDSGFENIADGPAKFVAAASELGYDQSGTKFKGGYDIPTTKGTLTELGWDKKALLDINKRLLGDEDAIAKMKSSAEQLAKSADAKIKALKEKVDKAKEDGEKATAEDKAKTKAKINEIKNTAKIAKSAMKAILLSYNDCAKAYLQVITAAFK